LTTCICETGWCLGARSSHLFKNSVINLTKDPEKVYVWLNHLEVFEAEVISRIMGLDRPRVWIGHFHLVDFKVRSETRTNNVSFNGIHFDLVALFQDYDTGKNSKKSPPRPSATHEEIRRSFLMDEEIMPYENYNILSAVNIDGTRKRKNSIEKADVDAYKTPGGESSSDRVPGIRRRRAEIYHHIYIEIYFFLP
jgi:hypothetical protein